MDHDLRENRAVWLYGNMAIAVLQGLRAQICEAIGPNRSRFLRDMRENALAAKSQAYFGTVVQKEKADL